MTRNLPRYTTNEDDWPVIAKFHAKWSVKLYEAIVVPYLKPVYTEAQA